MRVIVELGHAMKPNKKVLAVLLELVCTGEAYMGHLENACASEA